MVKAVAFDTSCKVLAAAAIPNSYHKLPGGGAEQDMRRTWTDAVAVIARVTKQLDESCEVVALSVTGQGDGTWLIDDHGEPVGDGLLWLDIRAAEVVAKADRSGARATIFQHTGCGLNACNQSAQLAWLLQHEPERIAAASRAMHCKDWLYYNLTGEQATDLSEGLFTFGSYSQQQYAPEILEVLGLAGHASLLPPLLDGSSEQHPLGKEAAAAIGLPEGLPVSLGSVDVICSALGGGIYAPQCEVGCTIIGTTGMHMRFLADAAQELKLPADPSGYTMVPPGFPDAVMRMQSNMAATLNIDWLSRLFIEIAGLFGDPPDSSQTLEELNRLAASKDTSAVYHPYIEAGERGPFYNPNAKAQFSGLDSGSGAGDLARALFEGLAYACRHCYEATGTVPSELRLLGGGARSTVLQQLLANVLDADVRISMVEEASALGATMMAAVAVGHFPDMPSACQAWPDSQLGPPVSPEPGTQERHAALYQAYTTGAQAAPPVWACLAGVPQAKEQN